VSNTRFNDGRPSNRINAIFREQEMWTGKMILVLSAALLAAAPACADETGTVGGNTSSSTAISHEPPRAAFSGNEGAVNGGSYSGDRDGSYEVMTTSATQDSAERKNARANSAASGGFHWTADGDRPALAYRFSESGIVRLRGNIHGARVVFNWNY
jgi:hypothetical protein